MNVIDGQGGHDTINAGLGNDTVNGGAGNDVITYQMGQGADTVDGGADVDTLKVIFAVIGANDVLDVSFNGTSITSLENQRSRISRLSWPISAQVPTA